MLGRASLTKKGGSAGRKGTRPTFLYMFNRLSENLARVAYTDNKIVEIQGFYDTPPPPEALEERVISKSHWRRKLPPPPPPASHRGGTRKTHM